MHTTARRPLPRLFVSLVSLVSLALMPSIAHAQTFESIGVRARGMAGAFVAVADDATATWWNPAGLASNALFDTTWELGRASDPDRTRAGGVAAKVLGLGLSFYRLPLREIRAVGPIGAGPVNRNDDVVLSLFGVTTGQSIGDHFVVASTLKMAQAGDTHADIDAGVMASGGGARLGLTVKHLTAPSFGSGVDYFELTRQVRAGAALVGHGRGPVGDLVLAFDADLTTTPTVFGGARHVAAGAEAWAMGRRVGIRGGLSASTIGEAGLSPSGGLSLAVRRGLYVDGGITGGSDQARRGWSVGLRATF
jgi:hypothetical protein